MAWSLRLYLTQSWKKNQMCLGFDLEYFREMAYRPLITARSLYYFRKFSAEIFDKTQPRLAVRA